MKKKSGKLLKSTVISIGMAMAIFCFVGIVYDIRDKGNFSLENYQFTKMVIGCVLVGLGFGLPTVVYQKDNLPKAIRVLIHMGIGCVVYTIVAYAVGWIGSGVSIQMGIIILAAQIAVAFVIWFLFVKYYQAEAKKMDDAIKAAK